MNLVYSDLELAEVKDVSGIDGGWRRGRNLIISTLILRWPHNVYLKEYLILNRIKVKVQKNNQRCSV